MAERIHAFKQKQFPYDDITLANPHGLQGGAYFSKIKLLGNTITLQTPKCKTKNGIIKTDKKIYCDLLFDKDNDDVVEFIDKLEDKVKNLIYEKKDKWFHTDMDMDTIDYHWQNVLRTYKGSYVLLRCFIKKPKSTLKSAPTIQIYDEDENLLDLDKVTKDKSIMSLLDLTGLKFTSQSFSLEFNLTQVMVLKERKLRNKCLIKKEPVSEESDSESLEDNTQDIQVEMNSTSETNNNDEGNNTIKENETDISSGSVNNSVVDAEEDYEKTNPIQLKENNELKNPDLVVEEPNIENTLDNVEPVENEFKTLEKTEDIKKKETDQRESENEFELNEINLEIPSDLESIQLKKPNEVYLEIYREVKKRAKAAKKKAIEAYLEAKRIKSLYLLDEIESSDDESELLAITDD